jgi:Secretion system C-terminal sorting domain
MKKFYILSLLALGSLSASAQREVVFRVDMTAETVSELGVSIAGNFQALAGGTDWSPGTQFLTDDDGNGLYEFTATFADQDAHDILFKFVNGNAWGMNEFQGAVDPSFACGINDADNNFNRSASIPAGADQVVLDGFYYNTCDASPLTSSNDRALIRTMNLTPNPATTATVLSFDNTDTYSVVISDLSGKTITSYSDVQSSLTIERNEMTEGMYFVTAVNSRGERGTLKLSIR